MAKRLTMARFEASLNDKLSSVYTEEQAFDEYQYFLSKDRPQSCSTSTLKKYINLGQLGTLIRRMDPIQFNLMYNNQTR